MYAPSRNGNVSPGAAAPAFLVPGSTAFRRANLALFCAGFSTFSLLYCVQPLLPVFSSHFAISPALSSMSLSCTTFFLALSIFAVGLRAERFSRKQLMTCSLLLSSLLTLIAACLPNWTSMLLIRSLLGMALGGVPAVAMAYLAEEMHPEGLGLAMGLYIGGTAFGGMAGRFITGLVVDFFSWRVAMGTIGVLGLLSAGLFALMLPPSSQFVPRAGGGMRLARNAFVTHLHNRRLLGVFALGFLLMGSFVTTYNYVGYRLLAHPYDLSQSWIGAIFLVYLVGIVASAWFGRLADRHGRLNMLTLAIVLMLGGAMLTMAHPLPLVIAGIMLLTFGFFAGHSVASGSIGPFATQAKALAASLYLLAYYLGSSVMGSAGGSLWSYAGWPGVVAFVAFALCCGLFICFRLRRIL
jgi:YNFM family putative membrane transporter